MRLEGNVFLRERACWRLDYARSSRLSCRDCRRLGAPTKRRSRSACCATAGRRRHSVRWASGISPDQRRSGFSRAVGRVEIPLATTYYLADGYAASVLFAAFPGYSSVEGHAGRPGCRDECFWCSQQATRAAGRSSASARRSTCSPSTAGIAYSRTTEPTHRACAPARVGPRPRAGARLRSFAHKRRIGWTGAYGP